MGDNLMIIYGRLTRDPEYVAADGDKSQYARFTVAVNRSRGDVADFVDCVAFGRRADVIREYFVKGKEIRVQGRHECDPYTGRDGNKRYPWTLKVDDFGFCGSKGDGSGQNRNKADQDPLAWANGTEPAPDHDSFERAEEDIPF